jgi:hypothetical protein
MDQAGLPCSYRCILGPYPIRVQARSLMNREGSISISQYCIYHRRHPDDNSRPRSAPSPSRNDNRSREWGRLLTCGLGGGYLTRFTCGRFLHGGQSQYVGKRKLIHRYKRRSSFYMRRVWRCSMHSEARIDFPLQ